MPDKESPNARWVRWFYLAAGILIVVAFVATVVWLGPLPPKLVVMTTGTPGSAYDVFAQRYKKILARSGYRAPTHAFGWRCRQP